MKRLLWNSEIQKMSQKPLLSGFCRTCGCGCRGMLFALGIGGSFSLEGVASGKGAESQREAALILGPLSDPHSATYSRFATRLL